jgi:hypothetical protein
VELAITKGHNTRFNRRSISSSILQKPHPARGQVMGDPGLIKSYRIKINDI